MKTVTDKNCKKNKIPPEYFYKMSRIILSCRKMNHLLSAQRILENLRKKYGNTEAIQVLHHLILAQYSTIPINN